MLPFSFHFNGPSGVFLLGRFDDKDITTGAQDIGYHHPAGGGLSAPRAPDDERVPDQGVDVQLIHRFLLHAIVLDSAHLQQFVSEMGTWIVGESDGCFDKTQTWNIFSGKRGENGEFLGVDGS